MENTKDLIRLWQQRAETLEDAAETMPQEDAERLRVMSHCWDVAAMELDETTKED